MAVALLAPGAALAQSNSCGSATLIAPGTYSGTTVGSTNDGSASCGSSASSPDVWYRIVPAQNGSLSATTCQAASYDTVLSIHNACGGGTELVCNDDSCGLRSSVQTNVTAGTTYYIRVAGFAGATGTFTLEVALGEPGPPPGDGPDVIYSDIGGISHYGPVGGVHAYALGTHTCNIGDVNLHWGGSWSGSPIVGFNAYRLSNGRLEQIGQSFGKKACCAAAGSGCAIACNGVGGSLLGTGCRDIYGSSYNGSHGVLAPRSGVNAFTGAMTTPSSTTGDAIFKRLQVTQADLSTPGALYFVEGVYVGNDDAPAGNALNNASYKRVTVTAGTFAMNEQGVMAVGQPAIMAWRTHGLGVNVEDTSVTLGTADVPDEGRFHYAHKVTDLGNGTFRYDYAVFNLNSDRSGGSFSVPVPGGVTVVSTGFRDVNYHSGEPYANTDWTVSTSGGAVTWSSPQTFAQNPNSNALRWG
ncbi:MAG TPA: hypothetical protein VD963_11360, partial [Phycisphaerales bacterium]|nr:hypothetical protein [Phycisphaerales bacterium]